jgi:hypothetical protein
MFTDVCWEQDRRWYRQTHPGSQKGCSQVCKRLLFFESNKITNVSNVILSSRKMLSMLDDQTGAAADQIGAPAVQTEASADQAALVDDQTGAPVVQTEASEAGDDKPGAAVEHHGAIADQPVAAAEETGAPDDETEAAPDQSEAFDEQR